MISNDIQVIDNSIKRQMLLLDEEKSGIFEQDFSIVMSMKSLRKHMLIHTPLRTGEHSLLYVTQGEITHNCNFQSYAIRAGDLVMVPMNYIITTEHVSPNYDARMLTFKFASAEYAGLIGFNIMHMNLTDEEQRIVESFYRLIAELASYRAATSSDVEHLIVSLLFFVKKIHNSHMGNGNRILMSASDVLVNNFLQLLAEPGAPQRHVEYYADRLHVSANHLQTIVRRQTNLTVMQWVNNKTIAMIQGYLRDKNHTYTLAEIAELTSLGDETSLSRFFKKETGITPGEYRKQRRE